MTSDDERTVPWTRMADGTREDYEHLGALFSAHARSSLVDNLVAMLERLRGPTLGYRIDRHSHCLQSATRALRADEDADLVVGALLHDIGDTFAPENHSQAAATILKPYVDERTEWVVRHHGLFQGYYYFHHVGGDRDERERFADSPYYDDCVRFCHEYDQNCFDPDYDNLPIDAFRPLLDAVFSRPARHGIIDGC